MGTERVQVTTQARRLARQHNCDERLISGYIYLVNKAEGTFVSAYAVSEEAPKWMREAIAPYATWAATVTDEMREKGFTIVRIGHGRMSEQEAQRYLDE